MRRFPELLDLLVVMRKKGLSEAELQAGINASDSVIDAYSLFMESLDFPHVASVADVKRLPFKKDLIKNAFAVRISRAKAIGDEEQLRACSFGYMSLSGFQENIGDKLLGIRLKKVDSLGEVDGNSELDLREKYEKLLKMKEQLTPEFPIPEEVKERINKESSILAKELQRLLA